MKVHIIGLQRSGTSWLAQLITHNYQAEPLIHKKHNLPGEGIDDADMVLVIQKRLDHWLNSVSRNTANLWQMRPEMFTQTNPNYMDQFKAVRLYERFYREWLAEDVCHIWYHDLLAAPEKVLTGLGLKRNEKPFTLAGDRYRRINDARREFYLDEGRFSRRAGAMATSEVV